MGGYEDLIEETVEAVLAGGQPRSLAEIERAARQHLGLHRLLIVRVGFVLRSHPERFVEVTPGVWARRRNGPDAGVPSPRPRSPLVGGAAAAVVPPMPPAAVDAVSRRPLTAG